MQELSNTHPLSSPTFESFCCGSWHATELISITSGRTFARINCHDSAIEDEICGDYIRLRSRRATDCDCSILDIGADVCVLSNCLISESSHREPEITSPLWYDAKIVSKRFSPHEGRCFCLFSVILYRERTSTVKNSRLFKRAESVTIDKIAILQKLRYEPRAEGFYSWSCSEDCTSFIRSKLFSGLFSSEISWLIVLSILRGMCFHIKQVHGNIVYQILQRKQDSLDNVGVLPLNSDVPMSLMHFWRYKETSRPVVQRLAPFAQRPSEVNSEQEKKMPLEIDSETDIEVLYDCKSLRRSKRQKIQPDRYVSSFSSKFDHRRKGNDARDEDWSIPREEKGPGLPHPVSVGLEENSEDNASIFQDKIKQNGLAKMICRQPGMLSTGDRARSYLHCGDLAGPNQGNISTSPNVRSISLEDNIEGNLSGCNNIKHRNVLDDRRRKGIQALEEDKLDQKKGKGSSSPHPRSVVEEEKFEDYPNSSQDNGDFVNPNEGSISTSPNHKSMSWEDSFEDNPSRPEGNIENHGECKMFSRVKGRPRIRPRGRPYSHNGHSATQKFYRRKLLSAVECRQLLEKCLENIEAEMKNELQQNMQSEKVEETEDFKWSSDSQSEVEDNADLWREVEHSITKIALHEKDQEVESEPSGRTCSDSGRHDQETCQHQHDFMLDEQIGKICRFCDFVQTKIRDLMPPFVVCDGKIKSRETWGKEEFLRLNSYFMDSSSFDNAATQPSMSLFAETDTVWASIPLLKSKLYPHQRKAFEFIWKNIGGSLKPKEMEIRSDNRGGCIISHSPGSGKTLLLISFISSYLKIFPKSRPLILVPKMAVYVWRKELKKWGIQYPLHIIYPVESFRKESWDCKMRFSEVHQRRPSMKMLHVLDCLTKFQKWHEESSILLMSYPSFLLMQRDSEDEYKKSMAKVLQQSPGLLILDEGHNPRSTNSKLRKLLMNVQTSSRVLLSGTLFQNNFEEYFNTLNLARPGFVDDVIRELDMDMPNLSYPHGLKFQKRRKRREELARKLFVQEIGEKIESFDEDDRKQGFDALKKITNGFIDIYEDDYSDKLPGLHIYTLVLMPTTIQRQVLVRLQSHLKHIKRYPIDLEVLITVSSIHPWLIKTMANPTQYFNNVELDEIEKHKGNIMSGCKVKFVFDLVQKSVIKGEKVLVFSHNIPPINLLVNSFENLLGWHKGDEVLVLQGDQELSLREKIMEKFNKDVENKCKLLIASTSACAEGISLTAASRVILIDSEWNHSKTRQAIARAFRPGQERPVFVYKLLASGTWEEAKYRSNEWKAWLSKMISAGRYFENNSCREVDVVDDEMLRELTEEDQENLFQMIMKQN